MADSSETHELTFIRRPDTRTQIYDESAECKKHEDPGENHKIPDSWTANCGL